MGKYPEALILDNGAAFYLDVKLEFNSRPRLRNVNIRYPYKLDIEERIKFSSSLIFKGRLRFKQTCKSTIEAFSNVQYDEKAMVQGKSIYHDAPEEGTLCDPVDSVCYAITYYINDLKRTNYDVHMEG